jgi:hypothetical protein
MHLIHNLDLFSQLDDFDIISALKGWQRNDDFILATLSGMIINRDLLKIKLTSKKVAFDDLKKCENVLLMKTILV